MTDLPAGTLRQHAKAHPMEAHELEGLGKQAAERWANGRSETLTDAVCCVVKTACAELSPEQIKRVVEFTNVSAYLSEFRKESAHKIVDFGRGGPANFSDAIKELNHAGGVSVHDANTFDYSKPPQSKESSDADFLLARAFRTKEASAGYPEENPYGDVVDLRDKIAESRNEIVSYVRGLELQFSNACENLYENVKQAALEGVALGEIVQAWGSVCDEPVFVKVAFDEFIPRLYADQVFSSLREVGDSLSKTASAAYVNDQHPLVAYYAEFCEKLAELAGAQDMLEEFSDAAKFGDTLLQLAAQKEASDGGLLPALAKAKKTISRGANKYLGLGEGASDTLGGALAYGAPALATYGAGKYVGDMAVDSGVASHIPGTQSYDYRRMQRQQGGY